MTAPIPPLPDPTREPATADSLDDLWLAYEKAACEEDSNVWRREFRRRIELSARAASEARVAALETALRFKTSEPNMDGYDGPGLLELVAAYMDVRDPLDGNGNHQAQDDLRRWAATIRALLAPPEPEARNG